MRSFEVEMADGGVKCEGDDTESRSCEVCFARSSGLHRSSRDRKFSAKLQGILDSYNGCDFSDFLSAEILRESRRASSKGNAKYLSSK